MVGMSSTLRGAAVAEQKPVLHVVRDLLDLFLLKFWFSTLRRCPALRLISRTADSMVILGVCIMELELAPCGINGHGRRQVSPQEGPA